jgi:L-asparaginase
MAREPLPRVRIIATGGTIGNTPEGRIGIDRVLADIGRRYPADDPAARAELDVQEVLREGAETFTPAEWLVIGRAVADAVADPALDGVVVTHGTFTAEETAYFLHLTIRTEKPVVVACAQRKHSTSGNDGDRNLLDAVRVAAAAQAGGKGVLLVMNEEIHSARDVTKTSQRPSGFRSPTIGTLGSVDLDRVTFYRQPTRRHTRASELDLPGDALPRVDVVATYAGADGVAVDAFVEAGARGLVVNGFSYSGKPHRNQVPALRRARERGIPVVLVNRGGDGRMPVEPGDDFVRGDNLTAQKARILLSLALTRTAETAELQRIFDEY